jgi:DNA-binding HxlR family transcriptional regulator
MGLREPLDDCLACGLSSALESIGERWSFLILRGAFNGLRHFEEFQVTLGIARNILANRLGRLVECGILTRRPLPDDRRKIEYRLTEKGAELLPVVVSLRQWGEKWGDGIPSTPVLVDERDHQPIRKMAIVAHDGRELSLAELCWRHAHEILPVSVPELRAVAG